MKTSLNPAESAKELRLLEKEELGSSFECPNAGFEFYINKNALCFSC